MNESMTYKPENAGVDNEADVTDNTSNQSCSSPAEPTQYIYAIGKLDIRFPSIGLEREFQQRERLIAITRTGEAPAGRGERFRSVLSENLHVARKLCYVLSVQGVPVYSVVPTGTENLNMILNGVGGINEPDSWVVVIGQAGPMAGPTDCGGLMVQKVVCDAFYTFSSADLVNQLVERVKSAFKKPVTEEGFRTVSRDLFQRIATSTDNIGALDEHRAINYLLIQHPGPYLAAAERADGNILDRIETRILENLNGRRIVNVIFTFLNRTTGIPERLFTLVDVTEEWPFLVGTPTTGESSIALAPFVDSGYPGNQFNL